MVEHSAIRWLHEYGRRYPSAWEQYAQILAAPEVEWPSWCFCPLRAARWFLRLPEWTDTVRALGEDEAQKLFRSRRTILELDSAPLAGIAAWRATQGIYRIYPTLLEELLATPITGDIPAEILQRLPEWSVYVETPVVENIAGFFAFLDHDPNSGGSSLVLLLDMVEPRFLAPQPIPLGLGTLRAGFDATRASTGDFQRRMGWEEETLHTASDRSYNATLEVLERLVSVLLYLCADEADVPVRQMPPPRVVQGKKRPIMPIAKRPVVHDCGIRIGAQLDLSRAQYLEREQGSAEGRAVQPHIRRAHWHTYWRGPRDGERSTVVRWLPPIAVNLDDVPEIAVVRPVGTDIES